MQFCLIQIWMNRINYTNRQIKTCVDIETGIPTGFTKINGRNKKFFRIEVPMRWHCVTLKLQWYVICSHNIIKLI